MSNERDELAAIAYGAMFPASSEEPTTWPPSLFLVAEAILAAGFRKPSTITTAEELDALPVGSVIRTAGHGGYEPRVAVKDGFWKTESEWFVADADDSCLDSNELDDLPATVLYEPEAQP